ncbi:MAG: tRNA (adenosine(37)-N6)-dimethylallyltransferase MiaA [Gammaproteobacteria bacterium]|nr:tRNA (adenosine(37)-N6)-dimethylallyltransferase MiaA [Gammaproteobacteria bacterium]
MTASVSPPPAVFLMGPTATGKTDLALALVRRFPFEIISVDSALVYRGMDIGTAKPSREILAAVPHHLIDICDPSDAYSAGRFRTDALRVMVDITARGRIPLLVGGTMLYFRALQQGLSNLPAADTQVRSRIEQRAQVEGWKVLHAELARIDPQSAQRIHPNDPQRIQRALEVYELTGRSLTEHFPEAMSDFPYCIVKTALIPHDRTEIHRRVVQRFERMMRNGFIDEVRTLRARGNLHLELPSMRAVGYRQAWEYLDGHGDQDAMIERAVIATRQLAKRQLTWLRAEQDAQVFDPYRSGVEIAISGYFCEKLGCV